MPYHPPRPALLLLASLTACPDAPVTPDGSSTGDSPSTSTTAGPAEPTTTAPTSTSSSSTGDTTGDPTTAGPDPMCATFLCGALLACCAADEACVAGECASACADAVRCGEDLEQCCAAGEVCLGAACVSGSDCTGDADCDPGSYCEPVAGVCVPADDSPDCSVPDDSIDLALEWAHEDDQVIAMPVVADITGDGLPEVVVNTARAALDSYDLGELIALDGATGGLLWRIPHNPAQMQFGADGRATVAAGDVSGDGVADIVYAGRPQDNPGKRSAVHAVDGEGALLWTARNPDDSTAQITVVNGAPALVNLDDDPMAEIALGATLLDHDGLVVWDQDGNGGVIGTPHAQGSPTTYLYRGGLPTFADLTADGYPELITGREAWSISWLPGAPPAVTLTGLWQATSGVAGDGWPAVADLDLDGDPEVVLTAWPELKILDGATGELWCGVDPTGVQCDNDPSLRTQPLELFMSGVGGPAAIADFDGDLRPELVVTTGTQLVLLDLNRAGEVVVKPPQDPMPAPGALYPRWRRTVQDNSSGATGVSAFDVDADGAAEVFFNDECALRIYDGPSGQVLAELANSTAAIHEYPVVADVDGDERSELLVVANHSDPMLNRECAAELPGWTSRQGLHLYRPAADDWTPTRAVWTQHTYHVTNADDAANVPLTEADNWVVPDRNDFRAAPHGDPVLAIASAPDLTVSLAVGLGECGDSLVLQAHILNQGALGVPAGVPVTFHAGTDAGGDVLATVPTAVGLVPGGFTIVETVVPAPAPTASYFVAVDPDDAVAECLEANNGALAFEAGCPG